MFWTGVLSRLIAFGCLFGNLVLVLNHNLGLKFSVLIILAAICWQAADSITAFYYKD